MPSKMKKDDDEDLKDLLGNNNDQRKKKSIPGYYAGPKMSLWEFCSSYISMMCFYYPTCCGTFACLVVIGFSVLISTFLVNPMQTYGDIGHDHSNIQSKYDLDMGKVDHWCLGGGNDRCPCEDPLQPVGRINHKSWILAYKANLKIVASVANTKVDVAFLGESIIEEMSGRWMGKRGRSPALGNLERSFQEKFDPIYGGKVQGVALGIAGDSAANVLWRLLHGELAEGFNPSVWWISLGNNDLARMQCSEEVVIIGILRVVEEILQQRPLAKIVINSVFPMSLMRGGEYPVISDFKDSLMNAPQYRPPARSLFGETTKTSTEEVEAEDTEAEKEEQERDAKAHVERIYKRQYKPAVPLKDTDHARRNRLGTFRARIRPLWTSVKAINRELQKFAENHSERVSFFDASELFIKPDPSGRKSMLQTPLISLRGHLTEAGFELWETSALKFLEPILEEQAGYNEYSMAGVDDDDGYINSHLREDIDDIYIDNMEFGSAGGDDMLPPRLQDPRLPPAEAMVPPQPIEAPPLETNTAGVAEQTESQTTESRSYSTTGFGAIPRSDDDGRPTGLNSTVDTTKIHPNFPMSTAGSNLTTNAYPLFPDNVTASSPLVVNESDTGDGASSSHVTDSEDEAEDITNVNDWEDEAGNAVDGEAGEGVEGEDGDTPKDGEENGEGGKEETVEDEAMDGDGEDDDGEDGNREEKVGEEEVGKDEVGKDDDEEEDSDGGTD